MKKLLLFLASIVVSCTNELVLPVVDEGIDVCKSPELMIYTRALGQPGYWKVQDYREKSDWMKDNMPEFYQYFDNAPQTTDRGESVSQAEFDFVMAYIKAHPEEGGKECNLTDYFIQNVGSSMDKYTVGFYNGASLHHTAEITGGSQMDYLTIGGVHVGDYNATSGPRALCINTPVVNPTYHDSWGTIDNTKTDAYKFYWITYEGKTCCYLCFDYRVKKWDNGDLDFPGDGVYTDWVIKLIPANGEEPGEEPKDNPKDEVGGGEVEVNLHAADKNGEYLESHLSVHVRTATDIEIFIPVPAEYYCEKDDMAIVMKHEENHMKHGGPYEMTYKLKDSDLEVKLFVEYLPAGIKIWTSGVTQEVIDWCSEKCQDGITFEIWNYYNDALDLEGLKEYLNQATIKFLDKQPDPYINAKVSENDCTVNEIS